MIRLEGYTPQDSLSENLYFLCRIYADQDIYELANNLRVPAEDRNSFVHFMRESISYALSSRFHVEYPIDMEKSKENFLYLDSVSLMFAGNCISNACNRILEATIERTKKLSLSHGLTKNKGAEYNKSNPAYEGSEISNDEGAEYSGRGGSAVPDYDFSIERDGDKGSDRSVVPASNFKIRQEIFPNKLTPSERLNYNLEAISMLNRVEKGERVLDESAQEVLARYVGWGGLSEVFDEERTGQWSEARKFLKENLSSEEYEAAKESTLTAFFTPKTVIDSVYKTVLDMGFKQGNILEPSMGIGHFIGSLPEQMSQSKFYGVELDRVSGRIGRLLYPNSDIQVKGFEETSFSNNFFDLVIGNVPFGDFKVNDREYKRNNFLIHDYFFAKSIDKVRNGGVIAFITSSGTMDKKDESIRKHINARAEFLGAIRLPNDTFNCEVVALLEKEES